MSRALRQNTGASPDAAQWQKLQRTIGGGGGVSVSPTSASVAQPFGAPPQAMSTAETPMSGGPSPSATPAPSIWDAPAPMPRPVTSPPMDTPTLYGPPPKQQTPAPADAFSVRPAPPPRNQTPTLGLGLHRTPMPAVMPRHGFYPRPAPQGGGQSDVIAQIRRLMGPGQQDALLGGALERQFRRG